MPLYVYQCPACKRVDEEFRTVDDRNRMPQCPTCDATMGRALDIEHGSARNASCGEIISVNAGVMPKQIPQANKMFGDLGITFSPRGDAVAPNRAAYLKYLNRRGLVNADEIRGGRGTPHTPYDFNEE